MKKLILGSVAMLVVGAAHTALAADMPVKALPVPVPVASWTGCYIGAAAGYTWGHAKHTSTGFTNGAANGLGGLDVTRNYRISGGIGGGEVGCNYQMGSFVVGIEGDISVTNKRGRSFDVPPFNTSFLTSTRESSLATLRGRIGYATENWGLWYVTGGGAWARVENSAVNILTSVGALERRTVSGWTLGYGSEYSLSQNWSVKSETLYVRLNRYNALDFTPNGCCVGRQVRMNEWVWRVGVNYRFGALAAPLVARY
jgi:outer membrane immunogenic protein